MRQLIYRVLGAFALGLATLVPAADTFAQSGTAHKVEDQAKMFSPDAIKKANELIAKLKSEHHKDLVIETFKELPSGIKTDEAVAKFASQQFDRERIDGIYILISEKPHNFQVRVGKKTLSHLFPMSDEKQLEKILRENLRADKFDEALVTSATFVHDTVAKHASRQAQAPAAKNQGEPMQTNWLWWIIVGIVGLLAFWLIMGIIRAMTAPRPGYGGPGMAGGPGGYGGGGGGGGFFSSLLGGLFGAAAGMWMYNNFFGGSAYAGTPMGGPTSTGGGGDYGDQRDVGAGSSGGGGDWGDENKGGTKDDTGGGDWGGGGGDAGGGGDWGGGGGGGDAGGGDWGGGGGGDWGGGGGGGGGDW